MCEPSHVTQSLTTLVFRQGTFAAASCHGIYSQLGHRSPQTLHKETRVPLRNGKAVCSQACSRQRFYFFSVRSSKIRTRQTLEWIIKKTRAEASIGECCQRKRRFGHRLSRRDATPPVTSKENVQSAVHALWDYFPDCVF